MPQKKHKPEEIVAKLRQDDVSVSQVRSVAEAVRSIGVTRFSYSDPEKMMAPADRGEADANAFLGHGSDSLISAHGRLTFPPSIT